MVDRPGGPGREGPKFKTCLCGGFEASPGDLARPCLKTEGKEVWDMQPSGRLLA